MSVTLTFDPGGPNELSLDESQIVRLNPAWTHTGKADQRGTVEITRDLDDYAQRQDRLNLAIDGTVEWAGFVVGTPHNERQGRTTIRGEGIAKILEENRPDYDTIGGPVTYTQIALHDAIRDYWGRTQFSSYNVTDQTTTQIENDTTIQSADTTTEWEAIDSLIPSTVPVVAQSGNLEALQSCFTTEAEDYDRSGGSISNFFSTDYSGSSNASDEAPAMEFDAFGEYIEIDFTVNYDLEASNFELAIRWEGNNALDQGDIEYSLDGETLGTFNGERISMEWTDLIDDGFLSAPTSVGSGSHTLRIEATTTFSSAEFYLDVVVPYDNRYSYTFDNNVTQNTSTYNYLNGPELYPDSVEVELDEKKTSYNITQANISSTWNDTSNNQAIAVSNDGGSSYTSSSNSTSLTANFSNPGRRAQTKLTFSRYGSRTNNTPATGFNGQNIQDYTLTVDLNDLVVIDSLELTRNHWDNLQTLHNYGDFNWVMEHSDNDIANIVVESFQRGEVTRTSPSEWDNPNNIQPEVNGENYFNSIYLEGALDDSGNRPTAEVKDSTAISNDNREIQAFLRDLTLTTNAGVNYRANSLLQTATSNNDLEGRIVAPPNFKHPGYAYSIDFGDGAKDKTLESVNWSYENGQNQMTYEFTVNEGFAEDVNRLKRQARDLENQV